MDKAELRRKRWQIVDYWRTAVRRGEPLAVEVTLRAEDLMDVLALAIEALKLRERLAVLGDAAITQVLADARAASVAGAAEGEGGGEDGSAGRPQG